MFTTRNAVLLAVIQTGIVFFGVLAAGLCAKVWEARQLELPQAANLMIHFGFLLFAAPMLWIYIAMKLRSAPQVSDEAKTTIFVSGIVLCIVILALVGYATIKPWVGFHFVVQHENGLID